MRAIPADKLQELINTYKEQVRTTRERSEAGGEIGSLIWAAQADSFSLVAAQLIALIAVEGKDI